MDRVLAVLRAVGAERLQLDSGPAGLRAVGAERLQPYSGAAAREPTRRHLHAERLWQGPRSERHAWEEGLGGANGPLVGTTWESSTGKCVEPNC